jgi:hypothetical protein
VIDPIYSSCNLENQLVIPDKPSGFLIIFLQMGQIVPIPSLDFYKNNSNLKWVVLIISILISIGSIYYTNILVDQLKERERQQVQLFAKAIEYTANDEDTFGDVNFIAQEILFQNNSIPIVQVDDSGRVLSFRNVEVEESWSEKRKDTYLKGEMRLMGKTYEPIKVTLRDPRTGEVFGTQYIYYKNSFLLRQLIAYPYIQLSVIAIFGFIAYLAFNYSKAAECNRSGRACKRNRPPAWNPLVIVNGVG